MSDQKKLSDAQYAQLAPLLPPPSNHLKIPHRQMLDAWLYVLYQGCTWRGLPREVGNWHTIYVRLNRWAKAVLIALDLGHLIGLRLGHLEADVVSPDVGC